MKSWTEFKISTSSILADVVADHLVLSVSACKDGVEVEDHCVQFWVESTYIETTLGDTRKALIELAEMGLDVDPAAITTSQSGHEGEWRDAWKKFFKTTKLTRQVKVVPSWEAGAPANQAKDDELIIFLDPGMAFGTGAHASTQLVLQFMQELADEGALPSSALDVGTGSGILAIAACKFWPKLSCRATDIDPHSVAATKENAQNNDTDERIDVDLSSLDTLGTFDLVLANIQAPILIDMAKALASRMNPGAHLALSGILATQIHDVASAFNNIGLKTLSIVNSSLDSEWSAVLMMRSK